MSKTDWRFVLRAGWWFLLLWGSAITAVLVVFGIATLLGLK